MQKSSAIIEVAGAGTRSFQNPVKIDTFAKVFLNVRL